MSHFNVLVIGDNVDEQLAQYQENNMADVPKEYLEFEEDNECDLDAETGKRGHWYNPNATWDWHVIGGRWLGYFKLKKDKKGKLGRCGTGGNRPTYDADQAKKGDIDFEGMKEASRQRAEKLWRHYKKKVAQGKKVEPFWTYGVCESDTKTKYIKRESSIATFAVVKDGEWYEKGQMGWFGFASNKKDDDAWEKEFEQLLADVSDDTLLTVVDCHI